MRNVILWVQSEDPLKEDVMVIHGKKIPCDNSNLASQAFNELTKASENLMISPKARKIFSEKKGFTQQSNFANVDNSWYIQGICEEKDSIGRNLAYMFLCKECSTFDEAHSQLKDAMSILNLHCNEKDIDLIKTLSQSPSKSSIDKAARKYGDGRKKKYEIRNLVILFLILIIVLVWIIIK